MEQVPETGGKFTVCCDADTAGKLRLAGESLSVQIGQRVRWGDGSEEIWEGVVVCCEEAEEGCLRVCVTLFHPEWAEGREVARVESQPNGKGRGAPSALTVHWPR